MSRRLHALTSRVQKIKQQLAELGDLRPGSLSRQYNVCGTPDCRCKADPPKKHGPYYQISFTWKGRSRSEYVRPEDVSVVRKQLRNYQRLHRLVEVWTDSGLEISRLQIAPARGSRRAPPRRPPTSRTKPPYGK